jgi:hypothetical protein
MVEGKTKSEASMKYAASRDVACGNSMIYVYIGYDNITVYCGILLHIT